MANKNAPSGVVFVQNDQCWKGPNLNFVEKPLLFKNPDERTYLFFQHGSCPRQDWATPALWL